MDSCLVLLAKVVLEFSHESVIIPLLIIGYIWINRAVFFHSICLVLISIIFNASLKATFQIPLNPAIGKDGFAFPSGHMQTSTVLYGFLYSVTQNQVIKSCLVTLLIMIGWGLIHFGYHNLVDVLGAVIFALSLIYFYQHMIISKTYLKNPFALWLAKMAFVSLCLAYVQFIHTIPAHLWMAYHALFGLGISEWYFDNQGLIRTQTRRGKLIASVLCFACLFLVNALFSIKHETILLISPLRLFIVGVTIPLSVFLSSSICGLGHDYKH